MKFICSRDWNEGVKQLAAHLVAELGDGRRVLWLVSGGSNVTAATQIMEIVPKNLSKALSIALVDERYGQPGHSESNWHKLLLAGFDAKQATLLTVLEADSDLATTAERYNQDIQHALETADITIAQLGMGEDGHIAGILPHSPAAHEKTKLVSAYHHEPLTRITLTFAALQRCSVAYVFAFGDNKREALLQLRDKQLDPVAQPVQFLKQLPTTYVYNDQIGEQL